MRDQRKQNGAFSRVPVVSGERWEKVVRPPSPLKIWTYLRWWPGRWGPPGRPSVGSAVDWSDCKLCPDRSDPAASGRSPSPPADSRLHKHTHVWFLLPDHTWLNPLLESECVVSPHRAAHRISELKRFLYLRISGVSLCGRMLVGLTLTTEILRASLSRACSCSCFSSSSANSAENKFKTHLRAMRALTSFSWMTWFIAVALERTTTGYLTVLTIRMFQYQTTNTWI